MKLKGKRIVVLAMSSLMLGCSTLGASNAVSDEALVSRTETAIGLSSDQFTIFNRVDEGVTARYKVRTSSGKQFNCFVGGSFSVMGRSVSEAVCEPLSGGSEPATSPGKPCDALSKAAKRC